MRSRSPPTLGSAPPARPGPAEAYGFRTILRVQGQGWLNPSLSCLNPKLPEAPGLKVVGDDTADEVILYRLTA